MLQVAPKSTSEEMVVGILAGVATSALLALLGLLASRVLIPWYQKLIYRGIDLEDKWTSAINGHGANYAYTIELHQSAHDLTGTATITKRGAGAADYTDVFAVTGFTWEGYVSLTLRSINRKRLSFATALLRVNDRGSELRGHWAYRSSRTDQVDSEPITLSRTH